METISTQASTIDSGYTFWIAAGLLFLWLCSFVSRDIKKIGDMQTDIAVLKANTKKIGEDVHEIKTQEKGVLNSALEEMREMRDDSKKERATFFDLMNRKFSDYDKQIAIIVSNQRKNV